jgi:hypothetical protein
MIWALGRLANIATSGVCALHLAIITRSVRLALESVVYDDQRVLRNLSVVYKASDSATPSGIPKAIQWFRIPLNDIAFWVVIYKEYRLDHPGLSTQELPPASCCDPLPEFPLAEAFCHDGIDALLAGIPLPNGLDRPPREDR